MPVNGTAVSLIASLKKATERPFMTIYSSLTAGVAGLLTNAHRLGSISDNIANSSTQGYKRSDTNFHSLVNKGLGGEYSAGGVRATTQRLVGENGAYTNTKNATDIAVRGRGLLPVTTRSAVAQETHTKNLLLTTTGSFRTDAEGYLTSTSGLVLMGWKAKQDGTMSVHPQDTTQGLEPIKINRNQFLHDPTTKITFAANLPATGTEVGADGSVEKSSLEYFDNLVKSQAFNIEFIPLAQKADSLYGFQFCRNLNLCVHLAWRNRCDEL